MNNISFAQPAFLYLLLIIIPIIIWYIFKHNVSSPNIQISTIKGIRKQKTYKYYLKFILFVFRIFAIALLIIALARPQSTEKWKNELTEGIDIIVALDISSSMLARDFEPNRLEASKDVAIQFISGRENDRIGLVVFSGESFTQCPLTTDKSVIINLFKDIKSGMIEDGTAIGMGLATSINRLKDSKSKSKVIILLTDGVNNKGAMSPTTAAEIAKTYGIRVYTVGVGSRGTAPYPVQTPYGIQYKQMKVEIDEEALQKSASSTDGEYFRATNNNKLKQIYEEIDELEKTKINVKEYSKKNEKYFIFLIIASILFFSEIVIKNTVLRSIP
ncbi:MAG: VWA domain-containing protein [Bacteroidales bacterium]|jgi:Ca-activated chloride channel family protein|nr:VWA domain-containing protein [Bacteroidales bacterium]